jgi:hypothetical protein
VENAFPAVGSAANDFCHQSCGAVEQFVSYHSFEIFSFSFSFSFSIDQNHKEKFKMKFKIFCDTLS